ncbi:TrmH family RNA methyltransferase [Hansschlegelia zhihuaiae]|uniref:RNA methyltransferase n=1 Tax=Hansschlegelia zhihuaiae TaxID=405005 RepID=A0A4Q0M9Q9_9HYPH|nr:RNA methyltransferase [Hansschlegelia zhihuaiae]RXF69937.1 RNA methyltransferase [Hansschlegelia zhihuaiae]
MRPPRKSRPQDAPSWKRRAEERAVHPRDHDGPVVLYGLHSVVEALRNPRRTPIRLLATENAAARLAEAGVGDRIVPEIVRPSAIDRLLTPDAVHQGLYLEAEALEIPTLATIPADGLVLVLDQITDPHNVGAIVRTAAAYAVDAIVTTARHSPEATGVLAKAASGGLEHAPLVLVQNLARALQQLGERGFFRVGLDSEGPASLDETALDGRGLALVLGAEGKGLRQLTRETCDALARLDMPGAIKSLNVSNAAAIALHVARRARRS